MRFHANVFEIMPPNAYGLDKELFSYLAAISQWELSSVDAYFKAVEQRFPMTVYTPVQNSDYKILQGILVTKIYQNQVPHHYGAFVVQSPLINMEPSVTIPLLLPFESALSCYESLLHGLVKKLGKRN